MKCTSCEKKLKLIFSNSYKPNWSYNIVIKRKFSLTASYYASIFSNPDNLRAIQKEKWLGVISLDRCYTNEAALNLSLANSFANVEHYTDKEN